VRDESRVTKRPKSACVALANGAQAIPRAVRDSPRRMEAVESVMSPVASREAHEKAYPRE